MIRLPQGRYFGSRARTLCVSGLRITDTTHAPGDSTPPHFHERPYICFVMRGGFSERAGRNTADCGTGGVVWHPAGDPHHNAFGADGAACLNIELDPVWQARLENAGALPEARAYLRGGSASWLAGRVREESLRGDDLSPFVIEALVCALVAEMARSHSTGSRRPEWLSQALSRLRDEFLSPPSTETLAADVHVHPSHFARVFHRHVGSTVGDFVRTLRIEWVCGQLMRPDHRPLSELSFEAGFTDQAHLCRTFRRVTGMTPGAFRRLAGSSSRRAQHDPL